MAHVPVPSLDLGHDHLLGLNLVGTVGLPSHPAGARIFAVRHPGPKKGSDSWQRFSTGQGPRTRPSRAAICRGRTRQGDRREGRDGRGRTSNRRSP